MQVAKTIELLSPAGDFSCLKAAINAGADAVYLAGERFGARAYAGNFTEEELIRAIHYARIFDVKIYLTVNTLIKEREMGDLIGFITPFYEAGLSGVIVQDLGAINVIHKAFPDLFISASTQMTITKASEANLLKNFGVGRIIPARELSLQEVEDLCQNTDLEVETFIHGAMCYCYSGQCLFSSMLGDRSANRGRCAGPCRMEYSLTGDKPKYLLSLKDMVTIDYIPDLIRAGVKSFKIEGRMKPPEYVAGVTSVYRKYIDKYLKNPGGPYKVESKDREILSKVYVRSSPGPGYLNGDKGADMISLNSPAYTSSDAALLEQINAKYIKEDRKIPVDLTINLTENEPAFIHAKAKYKEIYVTGAPVESAKNAPLTKEKIEKSLTKLGGTVFSPGEINVIVNGNVFLPVSEINNLRRQALEELELVLGTD